MIEEDRTDGGRAEKTLHGIASALVTPPAADATDRLAFLVRPRVRACTTHSILFARRGEGHVGRTFGRANERRRTRSAQSTTATGGQSAHLKLAPFQGSFPLRRLLPRQRQQGSQLPRRFVCLAKISIGAEAPAGWSFGRIARPPRSDGDRGKR